MTKENRKKSAKNLYWVAQKRYCQSFFKRAAMNGKKAVIARYGKDQSKILLDQVRKQFESFLPEIPYIGEVDVLKRQMLLTVIFASFYKILNEKEDIATIWQLCNDFNKETLMSMPGFVRTALKKSTFSAKTQDLFRKKAKEHQSLNLADQWDFIEGDGKTFDYGMNMKKCAKLIFLKNLGMAEFAPYVCLIDENFAQCCGYGLKRTQVLAEGADHCDFRLTRNGPIEVKSSVTGTKENF